MREVEGGGGKEGAHSTHIWMDRKDKHTWAEASFEPLRGFGADVKPAGSVAVVCEGDVGSGDGGAIFDSPLIHRNLFCESTT
jgi:hypothetical protein